MSDICQGSFSVGANGTTTVNLPNATLTPIFMELEIGPRTGTTETLITRSSGWHDFANARKAAMSIFDDGTIRRTVETTSSDITHYKNVSGTFTKIIDGSVSNPQAGKFDYTPATGFFDSNYTIRYKAFSA